MDNSSYCSCFKSNVSLYRLLLIAFSGLIKVIQNLAQQSVYISPTKTSILCIDLDLAKFKVLNSQTLEETRAI